MSRRGVAVGISLSLLFSSTMTGRAVADRPRCQGRNATIEGSPKRDRLRGTAGPDVIVAKGGNDRITARGGNDVVCGGGGSDLLDGGGGNDRLGGSKGGNDVLAGGPGNDRISGGPGAADVGDFSTAPGPVEANLTIDLASGHGDDELAGIENLTGSEADDALYGDELPNGLFGGAGNDTLLGNLGTDLLQPDEGDDTVNGGGDPDIVDFFYTDPAGPVSVDLVAGTATGQGTDTLISIEGAGGGPFDDTMVGENGANGLFGFGGNDVLSGGAGDADFVQGAEGDDTLDGGVGSGDTADYLSVATPASPVQVDLLAGTASGHGSDALTGIEKVNGTDQGDNIAGDDSDNTLFGFQGDDTLTGLAGNDFLVGREGFDTLDGGDGTDDCLDGEAVANCEFERRVGARIRDAKVLTWSGRLRTTTGAASIVRIYKVQELPGRLPHRL